MSLLINLPSFLKKIGLLFLAGLFAQTTVAQEYTAKNQVSFYAAGIFTHLQADLQQGKMRTQPGGEFGVEYTYNFSDNWGLSVGVGYRHLQSMVSIKNLQHRYSSIDAEGETFEFRYTYKQYHENQKLNFVTIPVSVQYQTSGPIKFYTRVGAKVGLATKGSYQATWLKTSTSGYYPQYNAELFDPAFMGFGKFGRGKSPEQDLSVKTAISATFEAGIKQVLSNSTIVYIGLFLDYGLNSIEEKNATKELIEYQPGKPTQFDYNGVFNSGKATNLKPIAFGVKIRYAFQW